MATLKEQVSSEFSTRTKLRYFQFAMMRAARVSRSAGTITQDQFITILNVYVRPWRKAVSGTVIDVLDEVRLGMEDVLDIPSPSDWFVHLSDLETPENMGTLLEIITYYLGVLAEQ